MKKRARRIFSLFLALVLMLSITSSFAFAEDESAETTSNEIASTETDNGTTSESVDNNSTAENEAAQAGEASTKTEEETAQGDTESSAADQTTSEAAEKKENKKLSAAKNSASYTVKIAVLEPLTDVKLTLTGRSGQGTFTKSVDSLASGDDIVIEDLPEGNYTFTLLGTNAKGVNVKGSGYAFCTSALAPDGVYEDTVFNLVENVKSNVTFSLSLVNPYPAKNGQKYSFYTDSPYGQLDAKLVAADGTEYALSQGSNGYPSASVPANAPYKLVLKGWSYGAIDGGTVDTTVKYLIQHEGGAALTYNLSESYFANDRTVRLNLEKYTFKEEQQTDKKTVTVTLLGDEVADCAVTIKTPDRVTLEATTDENGVAYFEVPLALSSGGTYTVTATDASGLTVTKNFKVLEDNTDIALPENVFKLRQQVFIGDQLISESTKNVPLRSTNEYEVFAPAAFMDISKCVSVTSDDSDITVSNITREYDNYGHAKIQAQLNNNQEVLLKYQYEYTDTDKKYTVTVTESYLDKNDQEVFSEKSEEEYLPGSSVSIPAQRSADSAFFKKDIPGFTDGAWFQTVNKIAGGAEGTAVGGLDHKPSPTSVDFTMPHGDVDVLITYGYTDTYVEYLANAQDAVGAMSTTWAGRTDTVSISENTYTRDGYVFLNWNTEADGTGDAYEPNDSLQLTHGKVSLYAQWGKLYTVTYTDGVEDEEVFADQVTSDLLAGDETPQFDGVPARDGYTFEGWSPDVEDTVSADAVYVALWKKDAVDEKTSITVNKVWDDENNKDNLRPSSVNVQLYADGEKLGDEITLSASNYWQHTWTDLDEKADGKDIVYTVKEVTDVDGYAKDEGSVENGKVTITNTHKPTDSDKPSNPDKKGDNPKNSATDKNAKTQSAKTGDTINLPLLSALLMLSATCAGLCAFVGRRRLFNK